MILTGVKEKRIALELSPIDLAAKTGLSLVTIYKIENGKQTTFKTAKVIAKALKVHLSELQEERKTA